VVRGSVDLVGVLCEGRSGREMRLRRDRRRRGEGGRDGRERPTALRVSCSSLVIRAGELLKVEQDVVGEKETKHALQLIFRRARFGSTLGPPV